MYRYVVATVAISTISLLIAVSGCANQKDLSTHKPNDIESILPLPVELTTHLGDRQTFIEGDEIQFLLSLGADAWIYMFYVDASGRIVRLLPNEQQPDNFYRAGYFMTLPEYRDGYRFVVSAPFGEEMVYVFASDDNIDVPDNATLDEVREIVRDAGSAYGEALLRLQTEPGR